MHGSLLPHTQSLLLTSYARRLPIARLFSLFGVVSAMKKSAWTWKTSSTKLCLLLPDDGQQLCQGPKEEQGRCVLTGDSIPSLIAVKAFEAIVWWI